MMTAVESLRYWHCGCGYSNLAFDPCAGCHRPAPRYVRRNTRARPMPVAQTALAAELLARYAAAPATEPTPPWLLSLFTWLVVTTVTLTVPLRACA